MFQKIVKLKEINNILEMRFIIYLSSGIVYYFIQKFDLKNVGIKEIKISFISRINML